MGTGRDTVERLSGKDLNDDGSVINLVVVGSSTFYDFSIIEEHLDNWVEVAGWPDLITVGGASGVDYLVERWADNNNVKIAVFHEAWIVNRQGLEDGGRFEARESLVGDLLSNATHLIAFPESRSKWTKVAIETARGMGIPTSVLELP